MRVLMPVRALPMHRLGGLEFHAWDLAAGLAALGHEVTLLTSRAPDTPRFGDPPPAGVRILHLDSGPPGDYSVAFFRAMGRRAAQVAGEWPADLIHAQEFAGILVDAPPARFAVTVHGTLFTEVPLDRRYFARLGAVEKARAVWRYRSRIALQPFFRRMLGRAGLLLADSDFTRGELERMDSGLASRIRVVPLGIAAGRYQFPAPAARPARGTGAPLVVAMLGRLQRIKGVEVAIRALAGARGAGAHLRLVVGGEGGDSEAMRALAESLGVADDVEFRGRVPQEGLSRFFGGADVFLFPDLTQPAFGLVAVEAMAHGLPVIGARSGAIPEVVTGETGWIYDPWSTDELASLLVRLASAPDEVAARAARAPQRALQFSAGQMTRATVAAYGALNQPGASQ